MEVSIDFEEFFALLNTHNVRYVVVGGYAYGVHAEPRYTKDLDIFFEADIENAAKLIDVLHEFGFETLSVSAEDLTTLGKMFQIGNPPLRIDLLNDIDGVKFNRAWKNKIQSTYGDQKIYLIGKQELIANKKASGRDQDMLDVKRLEKS